MTAAATITPSNTSVDAAAAVRSGSPQTIPKEAPSLHREWIRLLVATLARTSLILAVSMAGWSSLPVLLGWTPTTVMSGSMEPSISTGDVVVTRPVDPSEYKPGRVVLVDDPETDNKLLLHRIVRQEDTGSLVLRGDANTSEDRLPVAPSSVHGVGFLLVPYVGIPVFWVSTAQWFKLALLVASLILLCWASTLDRTLQQSRHRGGPPGRDAVASGKGPRSATAGGLESLGLTDDATHKPVAFQAPQVDGTRPTGRRSARLGAAVVASALALGTVPVASQAAFSSTAINTTNTFKADKFFTCGSAVLDPNFMPSAFYQFDNDTGTQVVDSVTPGTNNATFQGPRTPALTKPCVSDSGKAANFNGSTNRITSPVASMAAPTSFSYEMWFRAPKIAKTSANSGNSGKLISFGVKPATAGAPVTRDNRVLYMTWNGYLRLGLTPSPTGPLATDTDSQYWTSNAGGINKAMFNDDKWHHVAISFDGQAKRMAMYVDGIRIHQAESVIAPDLSEGSWTVGSGPANWWTVQGENNSFTGDMDNVAIYHNKVLGQEEVTAHFKSNRAPGRQP